MKISHLVGITVLLGIAFAVVLMSTDGDKPSVTAATPVETGKPVKNPEQPAKTTVLRKENAEAKGKFKISGKVFAVDGSPLQATLEAYASEYSQRVSADASGAFELERVPRGPCRLIATVKGFKPFTDSFEVSSDLEKHIRLEKDTGASILVMSISGNPIKGARVRIVTQAGGTRPGAPPGLRLPKEIAKGETDENGMFYIPAFDSGAFVITAEADGFAKGDPYILIVRDSKPVENLIRFVLRPN